MIMYLCKKYERDLIGQQFEESFHLIILPPAGRQGQFSMISVGVTHL
jgi:hypothetical protein